MYEKALNHGADTSRIVGKLYYLCKALFLTVQHCEMLKVLLLPRRDQLENTVCTRFTRLCCCTKVVVCKLLQDSKQMLVAQTWLKGMWKICPGRKISEIHPSRRYNLGIFFLMMIIMQLRIRIGSCLDARSLILRPSSLPLSSEHKWACECPPSRL